MTGLPARGDQEVPQAMMPVFDALHAPVQFVSRLRVVGSVVLEDRAGPVRRFGS